MTNKPNSDEEREAFEAWAKTTLGDNPKAFERDENHPEDYAMEELSFCWIGWQARAAQPASVQVVGDDTWKEDVNAIWKRIKPFALQDMRFGSKQLLLCNEVLALIEEALRQSNTITPAVDPDMPAQQLRLHMGELNANEMRVARAAIRWANGSTPKGADNDR